MANRGGTFMQEDIDWGFFEDPEEKAGEVFESYEDEIVADAQASAPWADRTGNAREGISAETEYYDGEIILSLYHTVEYGVWLETIQNGRFAILMPTLEKWAGQVLSDAGGRVTGVSGGSYP